MRWIIIVVVALAAMPPASHAQTIEYKDTRTREWTDASGQNATSARLVSLDEETRTVVLKYDDDTTLEVSLTDLSIADRKYITRQTSRARRLAKRKAHESSGRTARNMARPGKASRRDDGTRRAYNIDWHVKPQTASLAAAGEEDAGDDKPIIWFRVLGALDGFM